MSYIRCWNSTSFPGFSAIYVELTEIWFPVFRFKTASNTRGVIVWPTKKRFVRPMIIYWGLAVLEISGYLIGKCEVSMTIVLYNYCTFNNL